MEMPKFKVKAYEEIYYEGVIDAQDIEEAEDEFSSLLGEISPLATKKLYTTLEVKEIKNA